MESTRIKALGIGLVCCVLLLVTAALTSKQIVPLTASLPVVAFLGWVLMSIRSYMKDPYPQAPVTTPPVAEAPPKPPSIPPVPPVAVFMLALFALSCTPAERQAVLGAISDVGSCIVNQLVAGNEDPKAISLGCAKSTEKDVFNVVDSLLADANKAAPEGGLSAVAPQSFYARLQRVKAKQADGG